MSVANRLAELGLQLPETISPSANYVRFQTTGNLLFISGTGPSSEHKHGKVGREITTEEAYDAARSVGLQILATAKEALGSLDRITKTVKVLGMVNSDPFFSDHPKVINGCSDLLVEVLDEAGRHTRSAIGFVALPGQISVEIEATFEFE